jgi:hypothetical protein
MAGIGGDKFITASGSPTHEQLKIDFPSGVFQTPVVAFLSSFNANFGFNGSPHTFELEYVPSGFGADLLPPIGSGVAFIPAGDFFVKGRITHADYNTSKGGNILTIRVEDIRTDLDEFFIDTYGVFGSNDAPVQNMIDVRYWYVQTRIKTLSDLRSEGRSRAFRDLIQLERNGASYRQIYEAVKFFEEEQGTVTGLLNAIPRPEVVESQLPEDPDAYRWKFKGQPMLQALSKILTDISYDFYWVMSEDRIGVINRKFEVNIDKDNIPIAGDTAETNSLRFGRDQGERPTTVQILGAEMEGLIGCGDFKVESGAYGFALPSGGPILEYDLGIQVCQTVSGVRTLSFVPGWRDARVQYFGPDGSLREFAPTDRQLASALKGIEYFAQSVELDNRLSDVTIDPDTAITGPKLTRTSQAGRLGLLANRGQPGRSWIIEWYNRVRNFAQNHFGRTYVLDRSNPLFQFVDEIEVLPEAWCNIENQTDGGIFEDNYEITGSLKFLSPFWNADSNKLKGFVTMPEGTDWGVDGNGVPAQFTQFNEDETTDFVPIEARKWNRAQDKFKEKFLAPPINDEKGIMIRLPNNAWQNVNTRDPNLTALPTISSMLELFEEQTTFDFIDPASLFEPYEQITFAAIPVRVKRRYGLKFPEVWASGTGVRREVVLRDELAPWNFEPRGSKQSWELMNDEAKSALSSRVVDREFVTFAEAVKVGIPIISFDSFADQSETTQGYGVVSHGVTNLSLSNNLRDWWQTKYSLKSHFAQLIKAQPVIDGPEEDFNFIIKRLEEELRRQIPVDAFKVPEAFDPRVPDGREVFQSEILDKFEVTVTINKVEDRGANEFYAGKDDRGITWPRAMDTSFNLSSDSEAFLTRKAFAIDGFLQVGMKAVYHYEDLEDGTFIHYFTGGFSLAQSRVVELKNRPNQGVVRALTVAGAQIFVSDIQTLNTLVSDPDGGTQNVSPFTIFDVQFLSQNAVDTTLTAGTKMVMSSHGNKNERGIAPNANVGPNSTTGNANDAFLENTPAAGQGLDFAEVTTKPSEITGEGGAITSSTTGVVISDNTTVSGNTFLVRFVGADVNQVQVGDQCTVKQVAESGTNTTRVFCLVVKPKVVPTSSFEG